MIMDEVITPQNNSMRLAACFRGWLAIVAQGLVCSSHTGLRATSYSQPRGRLGPLKGGKAYGLPVTCPVFLLR